MKKEILIKVAGVFRTPDIDDLNIEEGSCVTVVLEGARMVEFASQAGSAARRTGKECKCVTIKAASALIAFDDVASGDDGVGVIDDAVGDVEPVAPIDLSGAEEVT